MGAALRNRSREDFVLSTKIGRILHPLKPGEKKPPEFRENGLPGFSPVFDYSYDGVMRSLEHSHHRLGMAKIDIALIHDVDFWTTKDRAVLDQRFKTVIAKAATRRSTSCARPVSSAPSASASTNPTPACASSRPGISTACCWPAATRCWSRARSTPSCRNAPSAGVSVILGRTGPYNVRHSDRRRDRPGDARLRPGAGPPDREGGASSRAVCRRHGVELGAAAMQFPLFHPVSFCAVIPGALSTTEVKQNVERLSGQDPDRAVERAQAREADRSGLADTELKNCHPERWEGAQALQWLCCQS